MARTKIVRCLCRSDLYGILDSALMDDNQLRQWLSGCDDPIARVDAALHVYRVMYGKSPYEHDLGDDSWKISEEDLLQFMIEAKYNMDLYSKTYESLVETKKSRV